MHKQMHSFKVSINKSVDLYLNTLFLGVSQLAKPLNADKNPTFLRSLWRLKGFNILFILSDI